MCGSIAIAEPQGRGILKFTESLSYAVDAAEFFYRYGANHAVPEAILKSVMRTQCDCNIDESDVAANAPRQAGGLGAREHLWLDGDCCFFTGRPKSDLQGTNLGR